MQVQEIFISVTHLLLDSAFMGMAISVEFVNFRY